MGVMRMGYVHAKVTDLAEADQHYSQVMGLYETAREDGTIYYKGWDEFDHHSVVIEEGGVGVVKVGFKVRTLEDLAQYETRLQQFGATVERMSAGENLKVGDGIRFIAPNGHVFELYHEMEQVGVEVGTHCPDSFPMDLRGIGAPNLDHGLFVGDDVEGVEKLFIEALDFYPSERMLATGDDGAPLIATWLSCGNKSHDIAFLKGPDGKLHHFAFYLKDWNHVTAAADILVHHDTPMDLPPTRHGITRGETTYFFDPSGNRNETFAGGYLMYPDRPCVEWTMDQLGKGLDYYRREVTPTFLTVYS
ncbi:catechol 2,3-dioxygenase [Granulicoccus phenolivorans]|uniref:catechol 2,3-dioxygenase n=1 Tax=Granulicoccus phenolivorans TaxID=266854 RepID=UPI0003F77BD3|nr:catechol 2,3-dioxygenase [Granulicoccus phenolivorans]